MARCIRATTPTRTPGNTKGWDPSMCAPMVMLVCKRPLTHPRTDGPAARVGYHTFVSAHLVRAVSRILTTSEQEACTLHYACKLVVGLDGYARVLTCSRAASDTLNSKNRLYVQRGEHENKLVRAGYAAVMASYETPAVGELHFDSHKFICGVPT